MGREAWQATVCEVAKSWTGLSTQNFFLNFIYVFIYFWRCWVCIAAWAFL